MIQWFPGHMAKALNQIKEKQALADLFIIVLDSRAPLSSYNAEFDEIAPQKPRLFVITKKDFADENKLSNIVEHYCFVLFFIHSVNILPCFINKAISLKNFINKPI